MGDKMINNETEEYREMDIASDSEEAGAPFPERELSVEEAFEELERLVKRMEAEGISLEESFACYEKGIRLVRYCNDRIDRVEKKVRMLRGEGQIIPEPGQIFEAGQ